MGTEIAVQDHKQEVVSEIERAKAFVIHSNEDYLAVDSHCAGLLKLKKKIEADFRESKETTYAAWKTVVAQERGHLDGLDEARRIDKAKMDAWNAEQERIRRAEEERLRKEAQEKADAEALAAAEAAEKAGNKEEAEAIIQAPVQVAPIVLSKSLPKSQTVIRKVWKYRVRNVAMVPREYLMLDDKKIGGVVRSMGAATNIPGVEVYQESM
ncbi:MAG: hypothetical protein KGL39_19880 [Patescibacteria group bacterium]|nr:hypothetical protein [Patescibacteria group bacterium]